VDPSVVPCFDAMPVALRVVGLGDIRRIETRWRFLCSLEPCPEPDETKAQVVVHFVDGRVLGVPVRFRRDINEFVTGEIRTIEPGAVPSTPPYAAPAPGRAAVGSAPQEVTTRTALPLCGSESAGLAGPFDSKVRGCFLAAVLSGGSAEFLSKRSDQHGAPFQELWRFDRRGPITMYFHDADGWRRQSCGMEIPRESQLDFDGACDSQEPIK
jgi:hypothetical protein